MKATELYEKLDRDFIKNVVKEVGWSSRMPKMNSILCPEFRQNGGMGLMCDYTDEIERVFTTVFLSDTVLTKILKSDAKNAMVFSHYPTRWNLKHHDGNYSPNEIHFENLKEKKISTYILHHPLDNYGKYSTCGTLADKLNIKNKRPIFLYYGAFCGVAGTTDCVTTDELSAKYTEAVGHETSLCRYGDDTIHDGKVAVCPGGGLAMFVMDEMIRNDIRVLITGTTTENKVLKKLTDYAKKNKINALGGTQYSSEKFAPMKMCEYFNKLGVPAEFVEDEPDLFDISPVL